KLDLVVKNESSNDTYEVEGIDGTELEEFAVPRGTTRSVPYAVPSGAATHKVKCYVPGGPSTIIDLTAGGGSSDAARTETGSPEAEETEGGSSVVPHADPDPEATSIAEVALDIADFRQGADEQSFTITNQSGFAVDLGGWSVVTNAATAQRVGLPAGVVLAPGQSVTVHTSVGANSATDIYLNLPPDLAAHVYTPGDANTGFIEVVSNGEPGFFRYVLPAGPPGG
ncbi:MAG: lamin tail domain-containing protein, partial [Dehalococcoidia bacterium]